MRKPHENKMDLTKGRGLKPLPVKPLKPKPVKAENKGVMKSEKSRV